MASIVKRDTTRGPRYDVRFRGPDGKARKRTFDRSNAARDFARRVEMDKTSGEYVDPVRGREPFAKVAEAWLTVADIKPTTRHGYRSVLDAHLLPEYGKTPIGRIVTPDVEQFFAELRAAGKSPGTIRNVRNALSAIFRYAIRAGAIRTNPVSAVKTPKAGPRKEMKFLTAEQVAELADAIDDRYRLLVLVAAYCGLRAGELGALKVGRVDLLHRRIIVAETLSEVSGALVTGTPKNGTTRRVPIPGFLVDQLTEHLAPIADDPDAYVFTSPEGGPVRHSSWRARYFKPAAEAIGMPELRPHDLRHTCVSFMIAAGASPLVISRAIGHGSIAVTYDVYGHVLPDHADDIADALDAMHAKAAERRPATIRAINAP